MLIIHMVVSTVTALFILMNKEHDYKDKLSALWIASGRALICRSFQVKGWGETDSLLAFPLVSQKSLLWQALAFVGSEC